MRFTFSSYRLLLAALAAFVALVVAGLWAFTLARINADAAEAQSEAVRHNQLLALAHAEQTRLVLRRLDEALMALTGDPQLMEQIVKGAERMPRHLSLRGIDAGLITTDGRVIGDGAALPEGWAEDLLRHHRETAPVSGFVRAPARLADGASNFFTTLSRPVRDRGGHYLGVAYARLDPQAFLEFFQRASLGPHDAIMVVGLDGVVRARRTGRGYGYGGNVADSQLLEAIVRAQDGQTVMTGPVDGVRRFYGWSHLREYELSAVIGTSYDAVMAPEKERANRVRAAAGAATALALLAAAALALVLRRYERAAARLRGSEARFRALTQMSAHWYWESDVEHRFKQVVRAPRYGDAYPEVHLRARPWELTGLAGGEPELGRLQADMDARRPFQDVELRRHDEAGRLRVALISGEPVYDEQRRFTGYRGIGRETTAQHEALAQRQAVEDRLAGIIESAMDAIITVDANMRILVFNAAAAGMFRCAPEQALGAPLERFVPPRFRHSHADLMRRFARSHATPRTMGRGGLVWAMRADGQQFPADASISHIELDGKPLYSVVLRDITARLAAEAALRDSEESYRLLFENNLDGLLLGDEIGDVKRANPAAGRLLGVTPQQIVERGLAALQAPGNPLDEALAECMRCGHARGEFAVARADGVRVRLEVAFASYVDSSGKRRSSVLLHDVTERHEALERQDELASQLRQSQKMEALGSIAGGIAHDFNNVIAAILGNARLAQGKLGGGDPATSYLKEISRAGYRARELVKRIMTFSRRQPAVFVRQPLGPVVREAAELLRATLPAGVSIVLHGAEARCEVLADATQLHQVVMNLGTNAWQAMHHRTGRIELSVDCLTERQLVRLSVQDNGEGMDEATQQRIFEPFFTTKPEGEGTGLGLPVVQGIVEAHYGEIKVHSELGKGCRFEILLPMAGDGEAEPLYDLTEAPAEADSAPAALPRPSGGGRHVVYVDDYEAMVAMVCAVLEAQGYRVSGFDSSPRALAFVQERSGEIDLLITDYNMPEMSGLDLARMVRRLRPNLPIIVASGHISADLREGAADAGVTCLFDKPAGIDELCLRIAEQLAAYPRVSA